MVQQLADYIFYIFILFFIITPILLAHRLVTCDNQDYDLALPSFYSGRGNDDADKLDDWIKCIKGDPLKCARRVIRILRSSDEHRIGLQQAIQDGNKHHWFTEVNKDGKRTPVTLPQVQLLCDVETR